jgi:hypothetical protein
VGFFFSSYLSTVPDVAVTADDRTFRLRRIAWRIRLKVRGEVTGHYRSPGCCYDTGEGQNSKKSPLYPGYSLD